MSMESNFSTSADDGGSLLTLLLLLVQNLRLLLIPPVLVGLGVFGAVSLLPSTYVSTAVQMGDPQLVSIYHSSQVRDAVMAQIRYPKEGEDLDSARERLAKDLRVSFNSKDRTVSLSAKASTPEFAQRMITLAIAQANQVNRGRVDEVERLRTHFDLLFKQTFEKSAGAEQTLTPSSLQSASKRETRPRVQGQQTSDSANELQHLAFLADALSKAQRYELLQPPTLPTKPEQIGQILLSVVAALGTGLALLLFVFARQSWRHAAQDPDTAQRLTQLRDAWRRAWGRPVA